MVMKVINIHKAFIHPIKSKILNTLLELFRRQGPPRRLQWDQLELKTPQERSDEEAEAKPTESEVVGLAEFNIQLYTSKLSLSTV